jgi:ComF family protein
MWLDFRNSLTAIVDHCLPNHCLLCDSRVGRHLLCGGCAGDLPYVIPQHLCKQCGLNLRSAGDYCGHCLRQPPPFDRSYIPFAYEFPVAALIHQFKYRRGLTYGKLLGRLLVEFLVRQAQCQPDWEMPDLIIPAPMHWLRRWQRGFNQAEILARYLGQEFHLPIATTLIHRTHKTPAQKELTRRERQQNLRKAFALNARAANQVAGKRVAIVDDVVTTTVTVRELSKLLRAAGASDIQIWALARTMEK